MSQEIIARKSVFYNRNYMLLFVGAVVSNIGNMLYNFAISLYILDITNNNAFIAGIYMATGGLVYSVLAPFGGAIVDRLDRVKVVYITDFIRGSVILFAGYLLFSGISDQQQLIMLFACTVILSINGALFGPATQALPANMLEQDQLQQSNSLMQGANAIYTIIGALAGAALYEFLGIELVFIINGATFIMSGISEVFITTKTHRDPDHIVTFGSVTRDIKLGFKYLIHLKPIFYLISVAMLLNFFTVPSFTNGLPYLFKVELQTSSFYYSLFMATFPVGIIIASIILGIKKQSERIFNMLRAGLIGMSLFYLLFCIGLSLHIVGMTSFVIFVITSVIFLVIMGVFNGFINIPFGTAIQVQVKKEMQGRVFSVMNVISMGLTPLAIFLGGLIIQYFGLISIFYIGGVATIILTFICVNNKYIKQL